LRKNLKIEENNNEKHDKNDNIEEKEQTPTTSVRVSTSSLSREANNMDWVNLPHRIACFQKLGDNMGLKMWKKRYFRLNEDKLLYSTTRDFSDSKGCILLNEITSVKSSENPTLLRGHIEGILGGTGGYFEIAIEGGRIYYLWAENVKERDEWISILTRVKTYYDTIKEYSKKKNSVLDTDTNSLSIKIGKLRLEMEKLKNEKKVEQIKSIILKLQEMQVVYDAILAIKKSRRTPREIEVDQMLQQLEIQIKEESNEIQIFKQKNPDNKEMLKKRLLYFKKMKEAAEELKKCRENEKLPLPKCHFEAREQKIEEENDELKDFELEVEVVKITNLIDTVYHPFVTVIFPYPDSENPQSFQTTSKPRDKNESELDINSSHMFQVERKKSIVVFCERKKISS